MLTADDFRRIALGMKDAAEGAHMGHPDFRVNGRIFATLHSDHLWGMVKLSPEQQRRFVGEAPEVFVPENGAWGLQGCTAVRLDAIDEETLGEAMTLAWRNSKDKHLRPRPKIKRVGCATADALIRLDPCVVFSRDGDGFGWKTGAVRASGGVCASCCQTLVWLAAFLAWASSAWFTGRPLCLEAGTSEA